MSPLTIHILPPHARIRRHSLAAIYYVINQIEVCTIEANRREMKKIGEKSAKLDTLSRFACDVSIFIMTSQSHLARKVGNEGERPGKGTRREAATLGGCCPLFSLVGCLIKKTTGSHHDNIMKSSMTSRTCQWLRWQPCIWKMRLHCCVIS